MGDILAQPLSMDGVLLVSTLPLLLAFYHQVCSISLELRSRRSARTALCLSRGVVDAAEMIFTNCVILVGGDSGCAVWQASKLTLSCGACLSRFALSN